MKSLDSISIHYPALPNVGVPIDSVSDHSKADDVGGLEVERFVGWIK